MIKKAEETRNKTNFSKIIFNDNIKEQRTNQTEKKKTMGQMGTKPCQTESEFISKSTQTQLSREQKPDDDIWVSHVDPTKTIQEEKRHNEVPPTMTKNTSLEASHELIIKGLVATIQKATNTSEAEEDTPLFRKKAPTGAGSAIHCRGN